MMTDQRWIWVNSISWFGLILALAGFVASLGIHLATFAGINARLYMPEITNFVFLLYIPVFALSFVAFWFRKRSLWSVTPLPHWVGTTIILLMPVFTLYALINLVINGWLWAPVPGAEDQLRQLRTDSSLWMMVFFIAVRIIADYGLGLFRFGKSAQPVSR